MKNTLKKRTFISAIAMLVVSAIVLTSSTFAWFSMAKRVEVETMELNITSPDGVQLSANTDAFTTMLTLSDIKGTSTARWKAYTGNQNNFPELLKPSSSTMAATKQLPVFYEGSITSDGYARASQVTSDTLGGYVAFDLFVQVGTDMSVNWGQTTITCDDNPDVLSAMRVAIVNCGTVKSKATAEEIQAVVPASATNLGVVMYEPNSSNHTEVSGYEDGDTVPDLYIRAPYSNRIPTGNGKNIMQEAQYTGVFAGAAVKTGNEDNLSFKAKAGINRIRVYLWMEGNDVDCANDVAGATIGFNLVFTIA